MKRNLRRQFRIMGALICLLVLSSCGNSNVTTKTINIQGMEFSIPEYYDFQNDKSIEDQWVYASKDDSSELIFQTLNIGIMPSEFSSVMSEFESSTAESSFLEAFGADYKSISLISSEDMKTAGLLGRIMNFTIAGKDDTTYAVNLCMMLNSYKNVCIYVLEYHANTHQSKFNYDNDFSKILESATVIKDGKMFRCGNLGDYYVEIKSGNLVEDYKGDPACIITYSWTNNSNSTTNAITSVSEKAFQDGVALDTAYISDSSLYDAGMSMKDVRPGTTIDIQCAYSLASKTSDVEFEISEWISLSDESVVWKFRQS